MIRRPRRWWPFYLTWIAFCAVLFVVLGGVEDPSRPTGRILSRDAGLRALAFAEARGLEGYAVVHVARARAGEGAAEERWVVLLDREPQTRLRQAVVVELDQVSGALLRIRVPAAVPGGRDTGVENGADLLR